MRALSPLATLERGYGVAQLPDGTVVTSIVQVSPDAELTIRVVDGSIAVRTLTTHPTPTREDPHG